MTDRRQPPRRDELADVRADAALLRAEVEAFRGKLAEQCGQTLVARAEVERVRALSVNNAHSWDAMVRERNEYKAESERHIKTIAELRMENAALRRALELNLIRPCDDAEFGMKP